MYSGEWHKNEVFRKVDHIRDLDSMNRGVPTLFSV